MFNTRLENFNQLHLELSEQFGLRAPRERRDVVIDQMATLEKQGIHCRTCAGTCCTSVANSMQITPLEALEILLNLKEILSNQETKLKLIEQLKNTIQLYRLDKEIYTGKKNQESLRKRYTCPFFNFGTIGCALSRGFKPYGCLGFNAVVENDNGQSCRSDLGILETREQHFIHAENLSNTFLKTKWNILWDKKSIPEALLEILFIEDTLR